MRCSPMVWCNQCEHEQEPCALKQSFVSDTLAAIIAPPELTGCGWRITSLSRNPLRYQVLWSWEWSTAETESFAESLRLAQHLNVTEPSTPPISTTFASRPSL